MSPPPPTTARGTTVARGDGPECDAVPFFTDAVHAIAMILRPASKADIAFVGRRVEELMIRHHRFGPLSLGER